MNRKNLTRKKSPVVTIEESLNKLKDKPLFQEKLRKANEILNKVGLPKIK